MDNTRQKTSRQKRNVVETITTDIVSALEDLKDKKSEENEEEFNGCLSVIEICEYLDKDLRGARNIVKDCIEKGTCEYAGKRRGTGIDGRVIRIPVYRFKFKNKKGKKK